MQEGKAGRDTVLAVFPEATVVRRRVQSYPILLKVFQVAGGEETEIYSGDQRGFFSKYNRRDAVKLKAALQALG
eukprot:m.76376 g.76376  ORF g.76376 m.76376 type:complete len:74 (+) comp19029_c0_seq1:334-555(+)